MPYCNKKGVRCLSFFSYCQHKNWESIITPVSVSHSLLLVKLRKDRWICFFLVSIRHLVYLHKLKVEMSWKLKSIWNFLFYFEKRICFKKSRQRKTYLHSRKIMEVDKSRFYIGMIFISSVMTLWLLFDDQEKKKRHA